MTRKAAADLREWDIVTMPFGQHTVDFVEFLGHPIDTRGTQAVRVYWCDHARSSLLAADKMLDVLECIEVHPSMWADMPPVRVYEDGSVVYGPYNTTETE